MEIDQFVSRHIMNITPYSLDADFPKKPSKKYTRMSLNENLVVDRKVMASLIKRALEKIDPRLYPEPHGGIAVEAISKFYGIERSKIFIGNGLDDVLDRIFRLFISPETKIGVVEPTFSIYSYYIDLCKGVRVPILLKENFELDVNQIIETCKDEVKILLLCSPNSPTGNQFDKEDVKEILSKFEGLIVVDETYSDFGKYSVYNWLEDFENLLVLKSFSKAYGLAGIRIGYLLANQNIVDVLKKSVHPFNVDSISQQVVDCVFRKYEYFKRKIEYLKKVRDRLIADLQSINGLTVYPSDTNFILFKVNEKITSSALQSKLREMGFLIKDRGNLPLLGNCLRLTVGTRSMNSKFVSVLRKILENLE